MGLRWIKAVYQSPTIPKPLWWDYRFEEMHVKQTAPKTRETKSNTGN
jgi:hypothetical protein